MPGTGGERKRRQSGAIHGHRIHTQVGEVYILAREGRPLRIHLGSPPAGMYLHEGPPSPWVSRVMQAVLRQLESGEVDPEVLSFLLDSPALTPFQRKAYRLVASIPRGRTLSYGEVAERLGRPGAARAVGGAMRRNPFPLLIPCHRVVRANGHLGGYSGPPGMKARLLSLEGADIGG